MQHDHEENPIARAQIAASVHTPRQVSQSFLCRNMTRTGVVENIEHRIALSIIAVAVRRISHDREDLPPVKGVANESCLYLPFCHMGHTAEGIQTSRKQCH